MLLLDPDHRPGLLVSVRDIDEARAAVEGGADVIDVKEPARGSLGAAEPETIASVLRAVDGQAPVTAAAGELLDLIRSSRHPLPGGLSLFKIGLAGCSALRDWKSRWIEVMETSWPHERAAEHAVAVAYADWKTAGAPAPLEVLSAALEVGCPALLVDTWDKSAGSLFHHWSEPEVADFIETVHSHRMMLVLAGSLVGESFSAASKLCPDLLAVRTAACDAGREGTVSRERVASLHRAIAHSMKS